MPIKQIEPHTLEDIRAVVLVTKTADVNHRGEIISAPSVISESVEHQGYTCLQTQSEFPPVATGTGSRPRYVPQGRTGSPTDVKRNAVSAQGWPQAQSRSHNPGGTNTGRSQVRSRYSGSQDQRQQSANGRGFTPQPHQNTPRITGAGSKSGYAYRSRVQGS